MPVAPIDLDVQGFDTNDHNVDGSAQNNVLCEDFATFITQRLTHSQLDLGCLVRAVPLLRFVSLLPTLLAKARNV